MKGKAFNLKLILSIMLTLTAVLGFCLSVTPKQKDQEMVVVASTKVSLGTEGSKEEFSALFDGGIIFSAEKVRVSSADDDQNGIPDALSSFDKEFYATYDKSKDDETFTFKNIQNGTENKTVVNNGEFVKLDNVYRNEKFSIEGEDELQEALLLSFGSYIYFGENLPVQVARNDDKSTDGDETLHAGITYLDVVIKKDGQIIDKSLVPENRDIRLVDGGSYLDFTYMITQQENNSNEGYYELSFAYMINNQTLYSANFAFYLINNTSYTQNANNDKDFGYNAKPTLGWIDSSKDQNFEKDSLNEGYVRYSVGKNGVVDNTSNKTLENVSYPTITYDYTKYKLSYIHSANQKNTTHDLSVVYNETGGGKTAKLKANVTSSGVETTKMYDLNDYQTNSINLVTIMLTEPGTYVVEYEFLYDGYVGAIPPAPAFQTETIKLSIHGLSTLYSKAGYEGAKMQYFEIASAVGNHVDLVVPNGYKVGEDISSQKDKKLGFMYSLVESEEREGCVLPTSSVNSLINEFLLTNTIFVENNIIPTYYEFLPNSIQNINKKDKIEAVLSDMQTNDVYAKTNQGSLWVEGNDAYTDDSFYFYSPTIFTADSLFKQDGSSASNKLTNTTSFNSKGYYLVFVKVQPNGLKDSENYWQVFAFQYTSSAVNINVEAINEDGSTEPVTSGKYTNKEVVVSWKKPGIFDRTIEAYLYEVTNKNLSKEQLLQTTKKVLSSVEVDGYLQANLGKDVQANTYVKYLIRLESEGESSTHKVFTIDRQSITGIQAYLVQELHSGNSVYYSYAIDKNNYIAINNAVTDGYATLNWNDKDSGANIYATYSYTPFAVSSDEEDKAKVINGNNGASWISSNYKLGTTIVGADLSKSSSPYLVESDCVLFNQGIYIIDLWDDAGNKSRYAFVIDRTENYFTVEGNCVSNASLLFGKNVNYSVGDYKVFDLDVEEITNETLKEFIEKAAANKLDTFENYYTGSYNNTQALSKLFQKLLSENNYYFTIANNKVVGYNGSKVDSSIKVDANKNGVFSYSDSDASFYKRTIYVVSENHTYSTEDVKTHSYVTIEINKDNARGSVYYSNDSSFKNLPLNGENNELYEKLTTGNNIEGAMATSAKHVAFVWNMGTGSFEVEKVSYTYYTLKTSYQDDTYYNYSFSDSADLYSGGTWNESLGAKLLEDNSGRGIVIFNKTSDTKAGLYIVTREYKNNAGDLGDDVRVKNYYFIVDRNGIIDTNVGTSIRIDLMEEVGFKSFSTQGTDYGLLSYGSGSDKISSDRYNIYLTTTKIPATLNIPTGKYYSTNGTSANYFAGQLNVSVYFHDTEGQLSKPYKNGTIKIYSSTDSTQINSNVFNIDIYNYLSNSNYPNSLVRDILASNEDGRWLFLPGDYIIRITDNVVNTLGENHVKYIGMRIATQYDKGPEVEIYSGYNKNNMNKVDLENKEGTVSQEYLKVVLPGYDINETQKAQVDKNYIMVDQFVDGVKKDYLYHAYKPDSGISLNEDSQYVTINDNGTLDKMDDEISVWLDTQLRNEKGEIDYAGFNKSLSYTITVRYKLNNQTLPYVDDANFDEMTKYQNCYVYYTTNGVKVDNFYYKTYTITIDREAPSANIEYLNKNDSLVESYNEKFETDSMIEEGIHQTNSNIYFTKQYSKYYQDGKQTGDIYIYQVGEATPFNLNDISRVYVKTIEDIKSIRLDLPLIDTSAYGRNFSVAELDGDRTGFGVYSGLNLTDGRYYEIVEVDAAGNATQYVVYYTSDKDSQATIPFSVVTTTNETKSLNISSESSVIENIFSIKSNGDTVKETYFFKIEVERVGGEVIYEKLTNLETNFSKLSEEIAQVLTNQGFGNFSLKISTKTNSSVSHIKLYNEEIIDSLETVRLVKDANNNPYRNSSGKESIYLLGANKTLTIDGQEIDFYATEITIKTSDTATYVAHVDANGVVKYYEKNFYEENKNNETALRNKDVVYIELKEDTTYLINMKDVFGPVSPYRFNTSGYEFVVVEFVDVDNDLNDDFYHEVSGENHMYYGFTDATLKFDTTIYTAQVALKQVGGYQTVETTPENVDDIYNQYTFSAKNNSVVEYRVRLFYNNELELTYFITINTKLSSVSLRDSSSDKEKDLIEIFNNVNFEDNSVRSFKPGSGRLTLYWTELEENNYFDYDFRLYEVLKDGNGFRKYKLVDGFYIESEDGEVGLNLNGKTSAVIATKEDSEGIYKFVISVYSKNGEYLGNRVFAFEVQEVNTQVYYVINLQGEEIKANSTFKFAEDLDVMTKTNSIFFRDGKLLLNQQANLPLYITNQEYRVEKTSLSVEKLSINVQMGNNNLEIFRISKKDAYDIFIGVLKIEKTSNLVTDVKVNSTEVEQQTSLTIAGGKTDDVVISATRIEASVIADYQNIINKNKLMVDIYYNGEFIGSEEFNGFYSIQGNGQYSFVFRDLAGNVHEYVYDADKNTPETQDQLDVCVLREVVVTLNGQIPIRNAFYNDEVSLSIFASSKYQTGSLKLTATKNGVAYTPKGYNPYVFSDYGTYRVVIEARYEGLSTPLTKVVTFTILNINEARSSVDLTGLNGCKITKVLNNYGEDKTEQFLKMMTENGGMNISHEYLMEYERTAKKADRLNVSTGKQTFIVSVEFNDYVYPTREITFGFTLNNETPTITCSLEKGDSTTKGFTISFNEAVIYEQIGESYIYINDRIVAHITSDSHSNKEQKVSTTYKDFGDGDYYVKIVSSSGIILDSYKVTIKEPLNTWAIIIIVVVIGVVVAIATAVIILRRKMRIR